MAKRLDIVEEKFLNTIKKNNLIEKGDKIVIGVSGGSDSTCLLYLLNKYKEKFDIELYCCHINHMIRKESTDDAKYVENLCEKMQIPFFKKDAEVEKMAKENKIGTEEQGRKIRYEFFNEIAKKVQANKIAIAHNMNDNAETMILNIIRGTGLNGLEGITAKSGNLIRPLINCKKEDINNFCKKNVIDYRIDSTNSENIYRRNVIRNKILPELEEINPNIIESLSRTSKVVEENNKYINEITTEVIKSSAALLWNYDYELLQGLDENIENDKAKEKVIGVYFNLQDFNNLDIVIRKNLIIKSVELLKGNSKNIEKTNIDEAIKLAKQNVGGKYTYLNKEIKVIIKNGNIFILKVV